MGEMGEMGEMEGMGVGTGCHFSCGSGPETMGRAARHCLPATYRSETLKKVKSDNAHYEGFSSFPSQPEMQHSQKPRRQDTFPKFAEWARQDLDRLGHYPPVKPFEMFSRIVLERPNSIKLCLGFLENKATCINLK